jgi:hypothetical protein
MIFYEVGYSSYEECPIRVICHTNQFSSSEFDEIVSNCYIKASKKEENDLNKWLLEDSISDDNRELYQYNPSVSNLFSKVYDMLIKDYGFTEPSILNSFIVSDTERIKPEEGEILIETYCDKLKLLRRKFNIIEPRDTKINKLLDDR